MSALENSDNELCPECGEFVTALNNITGWCDSCTGELTNYGYSSINQTAVEHFLLSNADHIEYYLLQGRSFSQAIDSLRLEIAQYRTCATCGGFIERGAANSVFCRKNKQCRKSSRRYTYLYQHKGLSKPEALAQVLEKLTGDD